MTPPAPKKSRPTWHDAVSALEKRRDELAQSTDYYDRRTRADALHSAITYLKTLVKPKKSRRRKSVAPAPHSNGTNGGAE
jgi:hypothetical protein